ncbi:MULTISPECIES: CPBP family intramembrane glutamic endopeptidase [Mycobacteriaceae]|uniref:CAAX amino protease n=1 Tax=Mycolicibacterium neoaurum VKM Ac-1815D TaxID=700508 RepID=V5X595_MYCNE|nr:MULTISPECIES: CPBP family intramembrane glutamic endopeptidase [Mycobacteriaceae]AHC23172.1 CAAX protease [Mycolicibacterium neoaurum VKM Ac-1815D]AMO03929.1 CAAX protease [Mycolicibacterium neoaurum]AXK77809.1 CPBP family intramembrane metalloprotease [Mycolicibacterium neoaurum]KJQ48234.1 CAAX protease [Mycolicibacterium neoaurum]KUM06416.1 CAAX protease [Mycolicibacterium neoaurum]
MTGPSLPSEHLPPRTIRLEIGVVLAVTFGLSAYTASLRLIEAALLGLSGQTVTLNERRSPFDLIDLGLNIASFAQLIAWGALALYLLWRSGYGPASIGLDRFRIHPDLTGGLGLAALIGLPGLALYIGARLLGLSAAVEPAEINDTWWRIPLLLAIAFANGWAEEIVVVAFLITRLQQLRITPAVALVISALLRGTYHLYQGYSAGLGNIVMGLVFGYVWLRTGRLWPLIVAHGLIDAVAFVGYSLAADELDWLG